MRQDTQLDPDAATDRRSGDRRVLADRRVATPEPAAVLPPGHRRGGGLATTVSIVFLALAVYAAGWVGGTASSSTAGDAYVAAVVAGSLAVLFGVIGFIFWRRPVPIDRTFDETVNRVVRFLGGVEEPAARPAAGDHVDRLSDHDAV